MGTRLTSLDAPTARGGGEASRGCWRAVPGCWNGHDGKEVDQVRVAALGVKVRGRGDVDASRVADARAHGRVGAVRAEHPRVRQP